MNANTGQSFRAFTQCKFLDLHLSRSLRLFAVEITIAEVESRQSQDALLCINTGFPAADLDSTQITAGLSFYIKIYGT